MTYYFVIDTDKYSGNFERQLCAFITGQTGECGVGREEAKWARNNMAGNIVDLFRDAIEPEPDDNGCFRPCKTYPTYGIYHNGLGFNYVAGEEDKAIAAFRENCIKRSKAVPSNKWASNNWKRKAENAATECGRFPSYQSVALSFYAQPDPKLILIMKQRAQEYAKLCCDGKTETIGGHKLDSSFNITGFRLIFERVVAEEIAMGE